MTHSTQASSPTVTLHVADQTAVTDARRWVVLAVVLVGSFMAILDASVMNVAVPSIREDLHATFGEIELVVTAYTLVYAALLITGGRLGDLHGRKNLFLVGLAIFTVASALCGVANSPLMLICARVLQGLGGALAFPQVLAILQVTFTGEERTRALAWFACVISSGAIVGQMMGGLLINANLLGLSWRPTFLINVPVGLAGLVAAAVVLDAEHDERAQAHLDVGGVALITATLLLVFVPLVEGHEAGWPMWMIGCVLLAMPACLGFFVLERRRGRRGATSLLNVSLFKQRAFAVGLGMALTFFGGNAGFAFVFALFLQIGRGFSPIQAALTFVPSAAGFFVTSLMAPRLVPLFGRHVLSVGFGLAALGYLMTASIVSAAGADVTTWELAPAALMIGFGQGLGMTPLVGTVLSGIEPEDAGSAAGVLSTTVQIGSVTGVTLLAWLFLALAGQPEAVDATSHYASALVGVLPVCALLSITAAALVRFLPTARAEAANPLIERVLGWATGLAYSLYLTTGGRIGDALFKEILGEAVAERTRRTLDAPTRFGDFLAYHFEQGTHDRAWLNFLVREALTAGEGPVPHERERQTVIERQVDEVRRRQAAQLIAADLDPGLVRLMVFALATYPRLLPQITRMTTGLAPSDPRFQAHWSDFLHAVGCAFQPREQDIFGQ